MTWSLVPIIGNTHILFLFGGLEHEFDFSIQLGISSSQLTNSIIFQRGGEKPPTRFFTSFTSKDAADSAGVLALSQDPDGPRFPGQLFHRLVSSDQKSPRGRNTFSVCQTAIGRPGRPSYREIHSCQKGNPDAGFSTAQREGIVWIPCVASVG